MTEVDQTDQTVQYRRALHPFTFNGKTNANGRICCNSSSGCLPYTSIRLFRLTVFESAEVGTTYVHDKSAICTLSMIAADL